MSTLKGTLTVLLLLLAYLFLMAFVSLALAVLFTASNVAVVVDQNAVSSLPNRTTIIYYSRSRGLIMECLASQSEMVNVISPATPLTSIFSGCVFFPWHLPIEPSAGTVRIFRMQVAYLVCYLAGLGMGALSLILALMSNVIICCLRAKLPNRRTVLHYQYRIIMIVALFCFLTGACYLSGCVLYLYHQYLELAVKAPEFALVYANFPSQLQAASSYSIMPEGSVTMWAAVVSIFMCSFICFLLTNLLIVPQSNCNRATCNVTRDRSTLSAVELTSIASKQTKSEFYGGRGIPNELDNDTTYRQVTEFDPEGSVVVRDDVGIYPHEVRNIETTPLPYMRRRSQLETTRYY